MAIQAINSTMPSFGAKLKNNEETTEIVNSMDERQLKEFKSALKKLDKHHEHDVLEIRKEYSCKDTYRHYLVNTSNNDAKVPMNTNPFFTFEWNIIDDLKDAAKKGSQFYNKLFSDNKEEEERKEVFSMMV